MCLHICYIATITAINVKAGHGTHKANGISQYKGCLYHEA